MVTWIIGLVVVATWRSWVAIPVVAAAGIVLSTVIYWFGARDYQLDLGIPVAGMAGVLTGAALSWALWATIAALLLYVLKRREAARSRKDGDPRP